MTGKVGPGRRHAVGQSSNVSPFETIYNRSECLLQLLGAFHDIADFDDIHQAAERLDAVQAWIRREARAAAKDPIFDDDIAAEFPATQATA